MTRPGLDVRQIMQQSFPALKLKPLDENDPAQLEPFIPPELKEEVKRRVMVLA